MGWGRREEKGIFGRSGKKEGEGGGGKKKSFRLINVNEAS